MGDGGDDTIATTASDTMEFWVFFKRVLPQLIKVALINVNNSLLSSQYGKTTHVRCDMFIVEVVSLSVCRSPAGCGTNYA
eukprot:m.539667 g.539667  ORF g.539667 m.539667 type:complete len:80 (+) comp22091_c0_seq21:420-659(+)